MAAVVPAIASLYKVGNTAFERPHLLLLSNKEAKSFLEVSLAST
jgi:hypothetical protein